MRLRSLGVAAILAVGALAAGCSSTPDDTCAELDRGLIAAIVGTEDFTTSESGTLPRQGGDAETEYRCTISVDDTSRVRISAGTVADLSEPDESSPDLFTYGAGRGYLTAKQSTLGCGTVMNVVAGTEVDENALDASRGAMAAVLVDLADKTGCRDVAR